MKAFAEIQATSRLTVNFDLVAASSTFARGNENNQHQPDGTYYLGPGTSDAYGVVNLGVRYRLTKQLELIGQVNNLFDHHYSSAAQLGPTGFTDTGNFIARPLPAIGGEFPAGERHVLRTRLANNRVDRVAIQNLGWLIHEDTKITKSLC